MAEVMADRELLELAAKAAGISGYRYSDGFGCMAHWNESDGGWFDSCFLWDPLRNDGDSLRLAVRLEFEVSLGQFGTIVYLKHGKVEEIGAAGCDAMSLCRRAIVRAAAKIGKGV